MHVKENHLLKNFRVAGINYKKNDTGSRGSFAITGEQYDYLLQVCEQHNIPEFFIISTCNRTEIYGHSSSMTALVDFLFLVCQGDKALFNETAYKKSGADAVTHLYNVTAGLDSQLLGDYEILAQVKNAYKRAKDNGRSGSFTERLVNSCIQASKAVKTNTKLSSGTVSVSFAAIQYIKQYAHQLAGKKIVLAGTGKIGKSTCKNLLHYTDFRDITLINRTEETAEALATECAIAWAPYQTLGAEVEAADVVIVSTNSPTPIINLAHVNAAKPQLFIDLSVPCNVDPNVAKASNVSLVNVDALSKLNDETLAARREEIPAAMRIIHTHQLEFLDWLHMRQFAPILKQVKLKLNEMTAEQWYQNAGYSVRNADATIQNVINVLATKIKNTNAAGCHYIEAINDYIACHGETY